MSFEEAQLKELLQSTLCIPESFVLVEELSADGRTYALADTRVPIARSAAYEKEEEEEE